MSHAEYSRPDGRTSLVTTGMAAENVAPPSVDRAYLGPSGESHRRWIVPPASARAATGRPRDGTATVVTRPAASPASAAGLMQMKIRAARAGPACGIIMALGRGAKSWGGSHPRVADGEFNRWYFVCKNRGRGPSPFAGGRAEPQSRPVRPGGGCVTSQPMERRRFLRRALGAAGALGLIPTTS